MPRYTAYVGLDVRKDSIDVAIARGTQTPEHVGTIPDLLTWRRCYLTGSPPATA